MAPRSQQSLVVALVGGSHFVNHAYFMLLPPLYGLLEGDVGVSDAQIGLALGTVGFVVTALQLPLGHASDRYGRTPVLALSLSAGALGALLTAAAQDFAWLVAASVVVGVGIAGHHPAHYPLLSAATTDATRGRAYSVHGFTGALGFAFPPAVVGLAGTVGVSWRYAVGAIGLLGAVYGAAALLIFRDRVDDAITLGGAASAGDDADGGGRSDDADGRRRSEDAAASLPVRLARRGIAGARSLGGSPSILALAVLWFATSVAGWGIKQYTQRLLVEGYLIDQATANLVVSAMLAVGAVLIFAGGWATDRFSAVRVLLGGYVALVAVAGVLAWGVLPVAGAVGLVLLLSATVDASRPARAALGDAFSTAGDVGKNFGLLTIGISGGAAVAPPVFGALVSRFDVSAAFYALAAVGVLALFLSAVVLRVGRDRLRPDPTPGEQSPSTGE